ncbi:phosphopantetheine adenylyltransferase [Tomitella fengzijianii]|uniref:phosphopantetheine adenylyltransferase n=1 Tax=Tomitella fengzijianii TaxID=2597660 RepID=UPI00131DBCEB|nr:phosphopantetheine adenylyltransferase [Tomitella fengzijianii]
MLVVAGLINTVPALGALSADMAYAAYGIEPGGSGTAVLLRHRGMLFGVIGIGLVAAAFRPDLRAAAVGANAISFAGFLALVLMEGPVNPEIARVAAVDTAALGVLACGAALLRSDEDDVRR